MQGEGRRTHILLHLQIQRERGEEAGMPSDIFEKVARRPLALSVVWPPKGSNNGQGSALKIQGQG